MGAGFRRSADECTAQVVSRAERPADKTHWQQDSNLIRTGDEWGRGVVPPSLRCGVGTYIRRLEWQV